MSPKAEILALKDELDILRSVLAETADDLVTWRGAAEVLKKKLRSARREISRLEKIKHVTRQRVTRWRGVRFPSLRDLV